LDLINQHHHTAQAFMTDYKKAGYKMNNKKQSVEVTSAQQYASGITSLPCFSVCPLPSFSPKAPKGSATEVFDTLPTIRRNAKTTSFRL
jgi:hypothetical protein